MKEKRTKQSFIKDLGGPRAKAAWEELRTGARQVFPKVKESCKGWFKAHKHEEGESELEEGLHGLGEAAGDASSTPALPTA